MTSSIARRLIPFNPRTRNTLTNNFSSRQAPSTENAKTQQLFFKTVVFIGTVTGSIIAGGKAYQTMKTKDWNDISKATVILSGALAGGFVGGGLGSLLGGSIVYLSPVKGAIATLTCSAPPLTVAYDALDGDVKTSLNNQITEYKIHLVKTAIGYLNKKEESLQNELNSLKEKKPEK